MYQSPIRLSGYLDLRQANVPVKQALSLAKRRLMAEFELAGADTIQVQGTELNRQEVISLFDELSHEQHLGWHLAIYADDALLLFLETGALESKAAWLQNPLYDDGDFLRFISPYFADACNVFIGQALSGNIPLRALDTLQRNKNLRLPQDSERTYRSATRFFTEKKNELLLLLHKVDNNAVLKPADIKSWCTDDQLRILNRLPDSYNTLRYQLANALNNLCVRFDQRKNQPLALLSIEKAAKVYTDDEELKVLIPKNLRIIRSKSGWLRKGNNRQRPSVFFFIALLVFLVRIVSCLNEDTDKISPTQLNDVVVHAFDSTGSNTAVTAAYHHLLKALYAKPGRLRAADSNVKKYPFREIYSTGTYPFEQVLQEQVKTVLTSGESTSTRDLLLRNESKWNAVLFLSRNDKEYTSLYLAPKDTFRVRYEPGLIGVGVLAGSGWKAGNICHIQVADDSASQYIIQGGYTVFPANKAALANGNMVPVSVMPQEVILSDSAANNLAVHMQ